MNPPDPQYGFQLCPADDPQRTHFFGDMTGSWIELAAGSGFVWQKPIPLPDGLAPEKSEWELVPEDDGIARSCLAYDTDEKGWHDHFGNSLLNKAVSDVMHSHQWYIAFARRKQPAQKGADKNDLSATHRLKCWPQFFEEIKSGNKTFEARKNDRDYRVGDSLLLLEWDPQKGEYTGQSIRVRVPYILYGPDFGIQRDFCVMSIELLAGFAKGGGR